MLFSKHKWEEYNSFNDPDTRWNKIKSAIKTMLDRIAPFKSVIIKVKIVPWIFSQLVSLDKKEIWHITELEKLAWDKLLSDWDKFKSYRNIQKHV